MTHWVRCGVGLVLASLISGSACRRSQDVAPEVYRDAVVAFHTALAAIETSQEVLAREQLDKVVALVPQEPAGWANLGLLLLRQQDNAAANERLTRAADLAPESAAIVRLQALAASREGNLDASTRLWRRAMTLDPADPKAAYALAQEIERQGGADHEAEAQKVLEQLLARGDNLPARLDYARLAAKRGDAAALNAALAALATASHDWPDTARERLSAVQRAAGDNPRAAATPIAFLRNVLAREATYRRALRRVTTPLDAVGEPITHFLVLPMPAARPARPDTGLTYTLAAAAGWPATLTWGSAVTLGSDAGEALVAADATRLFVGSPAQAVVTLDAPASTDVHEAAVVAADLTYDYRTDLTIAGPTGLRVLTQSADGGFADATATSGLDAALLRTPLRAGWPADVDVDGDLDLVLAPRDGDAFVARNNGDGTFVRQQPFGPCAGLHGFTWADLDGEGVPDAACLDGAGRVQVFVNLRGGVFEAVAVPAAPAPLVAIAAADLTADGRADLVGVTAAGIVTALTLAEPSGGAAALTTPSWQWRQLGQLGAALTAATPASTRLLVADLDNNAALDVIVTTNQTRVLLGGDGPLTPLPAAVPLRTFAAADLDDDGRLDLVGLDAAGRLTTGRASGTTAYHWQRFRLRAATATGDQRVNAFGIGGEIDVRTGVHAQTIPLDRPIVHVGLGEATSSDVVRVLWPNGVLQSEFSQKADTTIRADQRLKGSCPWLFAWDGREMRFVTDLIWRSPLGLRINAQATADASTTEDWVKVGGTQLVPRDGAYDLRITAELWETHFFDLVSLGLVDHPAGTEVFVDERFAVPAPALTPIVTGPLQAVATARDDTGRDVSAIVATRDDRHLDFAGRGRYQGVTRQHAVEIVLPEEAPRRGPLYLVAQGWVHPTDSSINVALAQGSHAPPSSLALEVADPQGRFRTARANLGFPSGKDKTVLIDLDGLLPASGERRLRLSTNLEVFWDRIAWAVGRPDVRITPRRLPMTAADLRYRGFSPMWQRDESSPERPRYAVEGTAPRWLDLEGFHTRFGDVRPLLAGVDDRYVIMNAGDELALRFAEAPPVAPGHVRDFIVIGDGWVKDGDYNTTFSRTVLPLPTHASGQYDEAPRRLEDDPVFARHAEDFATYHTRYVTPAARRALRATADSQR